MRCPAWDDKGNHLVQQEKEIIVAGAVAVVGVLALASGAVAADKYVITSTSQVKDSSIASSRPHPARPSGAEGSPGYDGATGATGATGANGRHRRHRRTRPAGPKGDTAPAAAPKPGPQGDTGAVGPQGPQGAKGDTGAAGPVLSSGNWGVINRNTIGSPSAFLRSGPGSAPVGKGSLNLLVGGAGEKVAYGTESDFSGTPLEQPDCGRLPRLHHR